MILKKVSDKYATLSTFNSSTVTTAVNVIKWGKVGSICVSLKFVSIGTLEVETNSITDANALHKEAVILWESYLEQEGSTI